MTPRSSSNAGTLEIDDAATMDDVGSETNDGDEKYNFVGVRDDGARNDDDDYNVDDPEDDSLESGITIGYIDQMFGLFSMLNMYKHRQNDTPCRSRNNLPSNLTDESRYVHGMSVAVLRINKINVNNVEKEKLKYIVRALEVYQATLLFLAFELKTFKDTSYRDIMDNLMDSRFEKRVTVLCKKYFNNMPIYNVFRNLQNLKVSFMKQLRDYKVEPSIVFYTNPAPDIKLLTKFNPESFCRHYAV